MKIEVITIGGKDYLLAFNMNTLCLMEEQGFNIMNLGEEFGFNTLRKLIYFGLRKHHKEVSIEDAGDLIQEYFDGGNSTQDLMEKISNALNKAFPQKVEDEVK